MKPDKRYGAFLILSAVFLMVFLFSSFRSSIRSSTNPAAPSVRTPPAAEDATRKALPENKSPDEALALKGAVPVFPVDINTAGAAELMLLPGVGEKTAQSIIEKRKELGGFRTIDELMEVKWIGKAKLARIRDLVTLNGGPRKKEAAPDGG